MLCLFTSDVHQHLVLWIPAVTLQAIMGCFFITPPVFSVPFSVVVPVSQSRHAMTAGSNAAEHRGRGDDVPSTPHCSLPERWCALPQTQYQLMQVRRGHK